MSEDAPELAAELVVDGVVPSQPVISPDGCWVAYVVAPVGRRAERRMCALGLAAADGSSPPGKLTAGMAADFGPRWAPDSASVFFLSDRTGSPQLHRIWLGGGEAEVLTDWHGEISDARPFADGRLVAVVATDEPAEEDRRRRAERDDAFVWGQQLRRGRLRVLDLATGELRTVDGLGDRHVVELAPRPEGGALAAISWAGPEKDPGVTTSELHVVDPETGTARDLGRIGTEARSLVWWQADGCWHLAYLARPEPFGGDAVCDVTVSAAAAVHRDLTAGLAVCPTELAQVADGPPVALFADGLDTAIYRLDPDLLRFGCLSARDGLAGSLTASRSGEVIAALASTSCEPVNVHAGPPGGPLIRLSDTQPALRAIRWGTQERLSYRAPDGLGLDGLLILPPGRSRADGPFPLITWVHGEDDTNVPVGQAIYFHRALSWFGAEHELVIYPREGHRFAERSHQLDLLRRTRAWFERWLRDGDTH